MLKQLGTFAILAVCLFALAMVGCDNNGGTTKPRIDPPIIDPPPTETLMEKLYGAYDLTEFRIPDQGVVLRPPEFTGTLQLFSGRWSLSYGTNDDELLAFAILLSSHGTTWSATETTLTLTATVGTLFNFSYSLVGERLTITYRDGSIATWERN